MFYLNEFTKLFRSHFMMCSIFVFSIIGMVTILGQRDKIDQQVAQFQKTNMSAYFNALVSGNANVAGIQRKMKNLPGVLDVIVSKSEALEGEISHLKSNFGEDTIGKLSSLQYQKIKIELEEKVNAKNQNLIREYLGRLLGKENVTLGAVKEPKGLKLNEKDPLFILLNHLEYYLYVLFFALFIISTNVLMKSIREQAFIISKFQRRTMVAPKILMMAISVPFIISCVINIGLNQEITTFYLVAAIMLIFSVFAFTYNEVLPHRVRK